MLQYFSETIINDANTVSVKENTKTKEKFLLIEGVGLYRPEDIKKIYLRKFQPEVKEKLVKTLELGDLAVGDVVRLKVSTFQQGLVSSIYADSQLKHVKPFFVEVEIKDLTKVAEELAAALTKQLNMSEFKFFTISGTGLELTLEAADCYTRFAEVQLVKPSTVKAATELVAYDKVWEWDGTYAATDAKASEGNGTVTRLIKDLRVPTETNHAPFAPNFGGRPIPGTQYDQYVIENVTTRRELGFGVVGAMGESFTKQVIFAAPAVATALNTAFTDLAVDVEEVK